MKAIERTFLSNDWITLVFIFGLVLIFLMKLYKPQRLLGYTIAFFTQGFIEKRAEQNPSIFSPFHGILFVFSITIFSLTLFLILASYTIEKSFTNFLITLCAFGAYYSLQLAINFMIAKTLNIEDDVRYFLFTKSGYLYTISLWLFPVLIIYQYGIKSTVLLLIFTVLLIIFRGVLVLRNNKNLVFNQLFYFILYFCCLELAPLLILYKVTTI